MRDLPALERPKTYWHLAGARRVPTDYEIASSRLLYYVGRGFEVDVPLADWYRRNQTGSPLCCDDWERFQDPRETTYAKYVTLGRSKEAHVEGIFRSIEESGYDRRLPAEWLATLERLVPPARHLFHGLQMLAAYVGQMAPSGRVTIAASFQAADEMRRVHCLAYRMADLRRARPTFGDGARRLWEQDSAWQPARRLVETMLVAYDFGEAFTALNLCAKPLLDGFFFGELAELARARGDYLLGELWFSLGEDGAWQRAWTEALVGVLLESRPANRDPLRSWIERWRAPAAAAVEGLGQMLGAAGAEAAGRAIERHDRWLRRTGAVS